MKEISQELLNIRPLYFFATIAEKGSFSRAASLLGVGQPVLSKAVQGLEQFYGAALFYRNGRGVELTAAGGRLLQAVVPIFDALVASQYDLASHGTDLSGHVTIGLPAILCNDPVTEAIRDFLTANQGVTLTLREGFCADAIGWLGDGSVDMAILYTPPKLSTLLCDSLTRDQLLLVFRQGSPGDPGISHKVPVSMAEVLHLPLILLPRRHRHRLLIEAVARRENAKLAIRLEVTGAATLVDMVKSGLGATILPNSLVRNLVRNGELSAIAINDPDFVPEVFLAHAANAPVTPTAKALALTIRKAIVRYPAPSSEIRTEDPFSDE